MNKLKIVRKRLIPNEEIDISNDELLYLDNECFITRWLPIKPRKDIGWGLSCTRIKDGYKISAFYDKKGNFSCWYCDVIEVTFYPEENKFVVKDLLVDVVMFPNGEISILDLEELDEALNDGLISEKDKSYALSVLDKLLLLLPKNDFKDCMISSMNYTPPVDFCPEML